MESKQIIRIGQLELRFLLDGRDSQDGLAGFQGFERCDGAKDRRFAIWLASVAACI